MARHADRPPESVDLYRVLPNGGHEFAGLYVNLSKAKQFSRLSYRGGERCPWVAFDARTGALVRTWECVGNPHRTHGTDCVDTWLPPELDDGAEPLLTLNAGVLLPPKQERIRWTLARFGRGRKRGGMA
jgi:hypothetical protein